MLAQIVDLCPCSTNQFSWIYHSLATVLRLTVETLTKNKQLDFKNSSFEKMCVISECSVTGGWSHVSIQHSVPASLVLGATMDG